jgi:transposase
LAEPFLQPPNSLKLCPRCGVMEKLYRTPRGLRCERCVKEGDSGGFNFG